MTAEHGRQLTVQGWQNLVLAAMGVVVLDRLVAGGLLMTRTDAMSRELIDNIQPARVAAYAIAGGAARPGDRGTRIRHRRRQAVPRPVLRRAGGRRTKPPTTSGERVGTRPELMADLDAHRAGRSGVADVLRRARHRRASAGASPVRRAAPDRPRQGRIRRSPSAFRPSERKSASRAHGRDRASSTGCGTGATGWPIAMVVAFVGLARRAGAAGAKRGHPPTGRPRRGVPAHHRGQLRRAHRRRAGRETSAPSRPTSRTCGSGSSTNSRRRGARANAARRAGRGAAAVQRRTRAVRLRRLPRPAGAAAQGRIVLPAAREAVRRQARRTRHRVHRVRRRRRQADAGADQRPAHVLPGRAAQRRPTPRSTSTRRWTPRSATCRRRSRSPAPRSCGRDSRFPTVDGDPTLLTMLWQNLIGNAVKFRRDGVAPRLVIECEQGTGAHDR